MPYIEDDDYREPVYPPPQEPPEARPARPPRSFNTPQLPVGDTREAFANALQSAAALSIQALSEVIITAEDNEEIIKASKVVLDAYAEARGFKDTQPAGGPTNIQVNINAEAAQMRGMLAGVRRAVRENMGGQEIFLDVEPVEGEVIKEVANSGTGFSTVRPAGKEEEQGVRLRFKGVPGAKRSN